MTEIQIYKKQKIIVNIYVDGEEGEFIFGTHEKANRFIKVVKELHRKMKDENELWIAIMMEYSIAK